jgi:peroxiredoxin
VSLLRPGAAAPDFTLPSASEQKVSLSDYRGQNVALVFYPADWSPVCGDQLTLYNELLPILRRRGVQLLAISVDSVWCHAAYQEARKLGFQLLADFEPKGTVAKQYGAYREKDGTAERALFLIDDDGNIQWSYLSPIDVNPGVDGLLDALDALDESKRQEQAS